ncbi:MAG: hypothetical protein J1E41_07330, partial [Ruminococcus sp.]|nr:hypothetical protein [Ruminococcus sp.]
IVLSILAIILYIFQSLALYTIAKKRNIENAWLAWIPLASLYIVGKIGDHFLAKKGKNYNLAIVLLIVAAVAFVCNIISSSGFFGAIGGLCSIAAVVLQFICIYQFYKGVNSNSAVVMLVFSIIFSVAMPFILFSQRNKDDEDVYVQPVAAQPTDTDVQ